MRRQSGTDLFCLKYSIEKVLECDYGNGRTTIEYRSISTVSFPDIPAEPPPEGDLVATVRVHGGTDHATAAEEVG